MYVCVCACVCVECVLGGERGGIMFMGWLTVAGSREGDRTECGHREEVVESTISLPLHTVGTWGAPTEAGERE